MDSFRQIMLYQKSWLEQLGDKCEKRLEELKAYDGRRVETSVRKDGRKVEYYVRKKGEEKRTYVKKEHMDHLLKVREFRYYKALLSVVEEDLKVLEKMIAKYKSTLLTELEVPKAYQGDINAIRSLMNEKALKWKEEHEAYKRLYPTVRPEELTDAMADGTPVRSKSEGFIGSDLTAIGLVVVYECPIKVGRDEVIYPDFTIYDPVTEKEYIWEHLGLMDKPGYVEKVKRKLALYNQLGYVIGDNLILTSELPGGGINFQSVRKLEMAYFPHLMGVS